MELMRRRAKHARTDYKTNEDILLELKINPVVKKIQNYRNKLLQHVRQMDRDRLPHLIMKYQLYGKRILQQPSKDF
jgi:hypothetical protein